MDYIESFFTLQFGIMVLASVAAFATVMTLTMPLLVRDRVSARMKVMAVERDAMRSTRLTDLSAGKGSKLRTKPKGFMLQVVEQLNLRKAFETEEVKNKLRMAGFRGEGPRIAFVFARLVSPIIMFIGALVYVFTVRADDGMLPIMKIGIGLAAGYLGFYLPNVFVGNLINRRQQSISNAFPDALDLLLICVQAGMSSEAAFGKVSKEISAQSLELAEELSLTTAELSYLQDRRAPYENLAKRTGIPAIKAVATALVQAERYGTPVGQALRVMAKENRELRMSAAEKKAAALPPKLTVPMIVFFLPVLFVVIIGPAAIRYMHLKH